MVKIEWTEFALEDLKEIQDYISLDSKIYADRYIDKLITRIVYKNHQETVSILRVHH
jgi:plasmid stabilization system protein ParE